MFKHLSEFMFACMCAYDVVCNRSLPPSEHPLALLVRTSNTLTPEVSEHLTDV